MNLLHMQYEKPDFILLIESWCNQSINDANLSIPGYQLEPELRRDRDDTLNGLGGGLLVYSRNGLKILPFKLQEDNGFHQHVCFKIITKGEPINIILAYRPPSSTKENVDQLLDLMRKMPRNTILIGDINVPGIDWSRNHATGARGRELLTVVQEEYLEQLVIFPTHDKGNILDLLITNMASSIILVNDNGKLGRSDHCIIATELKVSKMVRKGQKKNPNWTKADYPGLRAYMAGKDWDAMFTGKTTEQAWKILKEEIKIATLKFVPHSTVKSADEPKWINRELIRAIRKKKKAWKVYKLYGTAESRDKYTELEREVTKKIRNAKRGMEKKMAQCNDNNSRRFAYYIRSKTKTKTSIGPLKGKDGELVSDEKKMDNELNAFLPVCSQRKKLTVCHRNH